MRVRRSYGFGNIVSGDFTPILAERSKSFLLIDGVSVDVDRMQRNFEPMRKQVEAWQRRELTGVAAKVVIYEAFVEGKLEAPRHLARTVRGQALLLHSPPSARKLKGPPRAVRIQLPPSCPIPVYARSLSLLFDQVISVA